MPSLERIPANSEILPRSATQGYFQVPNSVAENQALLTPAEKAMLLIILRRGHAATCSDDHWKAWTGLDPKMKRHAINGLKAGKGLRQYGRGDRARFSFDRSAWDGWVRTRPRHEKARTAGRSKSVTAKPGQQIHPECRERGCQRMCETESEAKADVIQISPTTATPNWKPVSDSPPPESPPETPSTAVVLATKPTPKRNDFNEFIGAFLMVGVEMSTTDLDKCRKLWAGLKPPEKTAALVDASTRSANEWQECATQYVPRPWNYLIEKRWTRQRVVEPRESSMSKAAIAQHRAGKRFMSGKDDLDF